MPRPRRRFLVLAVLVLFAVSPAWARPLQRQTATPALTPQGRLLVLLSAWLGRTLPEDWLKGGCYIDPNGQCLTAPSNEGGCLVDPSGSCAPASFTDNGCRVDPNGHCASGH